VVFVKLKNKVAVITGGGRGIGQAIAFAFAREGATIIVVSRTLSELKETVSIIKKTGIEAIALKADISRIEEVDKLIKIVIQRYSRVDILVNCAGIFGPIGPLVTNDTSKWIEAINTNLLGTVLCCKAVLPYMIEQRYGRIINLSGGGAASPHPCFSAYSASKAAVVRFTETLSEEIKQYNIQANAIAPGGIATRLQDEIIAAGELAGIAALEKAKKIKASGGTPLTVPASLAVFLASEESDGLTGKFISAVWDDWKNMGHSILEIAASDIYTLRRVIKIEKICENRRSKE
jgi:NAD(P)-dependent dehydrogenase (short-subunit alcohol dehydrogenase family)